MAETEVTSENQEKASEFSLVSRMRSMGGDRDSGGRTTRTRGLQNGKMGSHREKAQVSKAGCVWAYVEGKVVRGASAINQQAISTAPDEKSLKLKVK